MVQVSVRIQYEVIGIHMAIHAEAKALFRTHEENTACIHAANSGYVQRHFRFLSFRSDWHGFPCFSLYGIGAGSDMEGIGPDGRIDPGRPGIDSQGIGFSSVQSFPVNEDGAVPVHPEVLQVFSGVKFRFPRGEDGTAGIDESAAINGDAVGIGYDHVRLVPCHFQEAIHGGGAASGDLVHDDPGRAFGHVWISLYVTCQFRFGKGIGIIQDGPFFRDIEPVIVIPGYTGGRGRSDMNQGNPIGRLLHQGMAGSGSPGIGHNGCCGENS